MDIEKKQVFYNGAWIDTMLNLSSHSSIDFSVFANSGEYFPGPTDPAIVVVWFSQVNCPVSNYCLHLRLTILA